MSQGSSQSRVLYGMSGTLPIGRSCTGGTIVPLNASIPQIMTGSVWEVMSSLAKRIENCSIEDQAGVVLGPLTKSARLVECVYLQHLGSSSDAWTPSAGRRDVVLQETSDDI